MITLYHGSNIEIDKIDLSRCHPNKDFGQGFYLTDIKTQAEGMAIRRVRIVGEGSPIVTAYSFDSSLLTDSDLNVKIFEKPSKEWALFVMNNRNAAFVPFTHTYDIVVGPIADDGVAFQLERYQRRLITLETLVEELTYRELNSQYYFGSEAAISKLMKI